MSLPKVPRRPRQPLERTAEDVRDWSGELVRIARTSGAHVLPWGVHRTYGPIVGMRWDPHPPPLGEHTTEWGIVYAATDIATAVAEVFARTRHVDLRGGCPALITWVPARPLRLLDLTTSWPLRNGAAAALAHAPRSTCRSWAHQVVATWPDLDGLWTRSTMTDRPVVALFGAAADSWPDAPRSVDSLGDPYLRAVLRAIAREIGYTL